MAEVQERGLAVLPSEERIQENESQRLTLVAQAEALVVDSPESEEVAWAIVNGIGELTKRITADFAPSRTAAHQAWTAAHQAWKAIVAQEKGHLARLEEPDKIVRGKLSAWEQEKRRRQAEIDRKAREAAAKVQAELQRQGDEAARKAAEERRLQEAMEAEAAGDAAKAGELLETLVEVTPVEVPTVVVPTLKAEKVAGAGAMVERWTFEITDPQAIPREYLTVNESAIGKVVQALKGQTNIPGVRAYSVLEARRTGARQ